MPSADEATSESTIRHGVILLNRLSELKITKIVHNKFKLCVPRYQREVSLLAQIRHSAFLAQGIALWR